MQLIQEPFQVILWGTSPYGMSFSQKQWDEFKDQVPVISKHTANAKQLKLDFKESEMQLTVKQFKTQQYITFKKEKVGEDKKVTTLSVTLSPQEWDVFVGLFATIDTLMVA